MEYCRNLDNVMESTGSPFPKWQLAILLGTPVAIGIGYLYWRKQQQPIEEGTDENGEKDGKKLKKGNKSISIDGDTFANGDVNKKAMGNEAVKPKELSPFEQAVKFKEQGNDCFKAAKYDEAINYYNQAIDVCPEAKAIDLSQFYQNRAAAYEQLKKWSAVEKVRFKA